MAAEPPAQREAREHREAVMMLRYSLREALRNKDADAAAYCRFELSKLGVEPEPERGTWGRFLAFFRI